MPRDIYIHREIEDTLKRTVKQFPCVALTGPRQSGKSTLLKNLFGNTHQIVSFDEPLARQKAISDPKLFLENLREPVIFDEIQYVPEILSYLKILIDNDRLRRGRFILTGSQQFNLIKNLGDSLAGRVGLLTLLPFSHAEKERITRLKNALLTTQQAFIDACLRGSFPELNMHPRIDFEVWYGSYLQTYLERDVRNIYDIGSLREFQRFIQVLAARCGQFLSLSDMSNELGISANTVKKWLSILVASQLVYLLSPYYRNLGKRITKTPKVYFTDCGLVCFLTGIRDKKYLLNGPMAGPLFENFIIQETLKVYASRVKMPNMFYLRTHNELEVDLIIEKDTRIYPFEVKLSKSPNTNMAKSIERFKNIFSQQNIMPGKVICLSDKDEFLSANVSTQSLSSYLKWLKDG